MATTTTTAATHHTPSSSPRRRARASDPFLSLPITPPPTSTTDQPTTETPKQALIIKLLLTPLLTTTFILSLLYTNTRDRTIRASHAPHATKPPSLFSSIFSSSSSSLAAAEPYQRPADSTWDVDSTGSGDDGKKGGDVWVMRKKHRKMARLQIGDALEGMRVVVRVLGVLGCAAVVVLGVWGWGVWMRWG
ncbi:hypothetical protein EJ05DRAFT_499734 [Pseudovirgaria hyperparasitica]|uniref:Uncharacterized protein n=1 Tax=Pseudovirgaria hyperparasitica TaxID=470096 RepID=A0A6A6WDY1_9PEZI|nr:uncharacterized protein EJ05DRAFT_499734 [Pseudovirgaria hyperparasitica]KAF2759321.1 hypothetical protein EJ05DRAFT_499734 [Pseudovirgaria hyperparasitica]